jgi:hypothetical protein
MPFVGPLTLTGRHVRLEPLGREHGAGLAAAAAAGERWRLRIASRAAIARRGARQDGILRDSPILPDGTLRDTVAFSIIAGERPAVKRQLVFLPERPRERRC